MSKKAKLQTVVPGWADNSLLFLAVSATYVAIWAVDNDPATAADRWPLIHKIFVDRIIFYRVFNPETIVPFSITVITVCIYTVVSVAVAIWSYFRLRRQGALSFDFEDRKQRRALLLGLPFVVLAVFVALFSYPSSYNPREFDSTRFLLWPVFPTFAIMNAFLVVAWVRYAALRVLEAFRSSRDDR